TDGECASVRRKRDMEQSRMEASLSRGAESRWYWKALEGFPRIHLDNRVIPVANDDGSLSVSRNSHSSATIEIQFGLLVRHRFIPAKAALAVGNDEGRVIGG